MFLGSLSLTNHIPAHLSPAAPDPVQLTMSVTGACLKKGRDECCGGKIHIQQIDSDLEFHQENK